MPKIVQSPEAATKELLTNFQVYLDHSEDGLTELFARNQQAVGPISREIAQLRQVKSVNDPDTVERLFNASPDSPTSFVMTYIVESKKLVSLLTEKTNRSLPSDESAPLLYINEEDIISITQQDLDNVQKFVEIMSKNKNPPFFDKPYFESIPLSAEERDAIIKAQQKTRDTVEQTLAERLNRFSQGVPVAHWQPVTISSLQDLSASGDTSNKDILTHHQLLKRYQACKEVIKKMKDEIKNSYERLGISGLMIEDSPQEEAFNAQLTELVRVNDQLSNRLISKSKASLFHEVPAQSTILPKKITGMKPSK